MTNWRARGVAGSSLSKGAILWLQTNTYCCLVLVQPDFEINEVLNSIIIVHVRCGGGEGFAIEWGCLVIFRLSLRLR